MHSSPNITIRSSSTHPHVIDLYRQYFEVFVGGPDRPTHFDYME